MNSEKILFALNLLASKFYKKKPDTDEAIQIVCVKWDEIGDMVNALHVFTALKKEYPKGNLTVLCKPFVDSLLSGITEIDAVVTSLDQLPKKVEIWVELRGTWKSLFRSLKCRVKYRCDRGSIRFKQRGNQLHEQVTNWKIVEPLLSSKIPLRSVLKIGNESQNRALDIIHSISFNSNEYVLIHPSARSELRRWPADRFGRLAKYIYQEFQLKVLIIGTQEELEILSEVVEHSENTATVYISRESLTVFASIVQQCVLFVGNESGPLQIADALGKKSISLFGPGVKDVFYPQTSGSKIFHEVLECNPCDQVHCIHAHNPCIARIEELSVMSAVDELLK
jgi:heptosyltransferase-2